MKKIILSTLAAVTFLFSVNAVASYPQGKGKHTVRIKEGEYQPGIIIVKMKNEVRPQCSMNGIAVNSLSQKLAQLGATATGKMFPHAECPSVMRTMANQPFVDLTLVYQITYSANININDALDLLKSDPNVVYAEPHYIQHTCYTPNDGTGLSLAWHLTNIQAYAGWDIWRGDTNTVIGIVDSGTDWDHPDLAANVKLNYADPINGIDDDGDGYIDNFRGWDISDNDNDPTVGSQVHGSHVSGCADAVTDNGTGLASAAFNCKFIAVKAAHDASTTSIDNGYEAIAYAADHGVNVINCSWGRAGGFSQFEQDAMNYAAINRNVTVCVAAGNDNLEEDFWPAAYEHVVSVAATSSNDVKASFSNYGGRVDVSAPGDNIYATVYNDSYTYMSGTSMASPVAAGVAAMIKSKFPSFNSLQVAEQLKVTCDNIYGLLGNNAYQNKLGSGRVNLFKALTDTTSEGIDVTNVNLTDGNDNVFLFGDTLNLSALFTNLLHPSTSALTATLTATSTYVTVLTNTFNLGVLGTMDTISNSNAPFRIRIRNTAPLNAIIPLKITLTDGAYSSFYLLNVQVNVDYLNITVNDIGTTATSNGRIGYNLVGSAGLGFLYQGSATNLYESSLMVGDGTHSVADGVRGATAGNTDLDFSDVTRITRQLPSTVADWYSFGTINDALAPTPMNLLINHREYAWTAPPNQGFVIFEYVIKNNGTSTLNNLCAGIFADFDVNNQAGTSHYDNNRDTVDGVRQMGYVYNTQPDGYLCGIKLLSHGPFHHYGIDNDTVAGGGGGGITLMTGFSEADKYTAISTDRPAAGRATTNPGGNDVCDVTSSGPFTVAVGDSVTVAFALVSGLDLGTIQASADAAQIKYDSLSLGIGEIPIARGFSLDQNFPNPVINQTNINFNLSETNNTELALYNAMGQKVKTLVSEKLNAGSYKLYVDMTDVQGGVYYLKLTSGEHSQIRPMTITH